MFHPNLQAFFPNDRKAYPLYEEIAAAGLPALFHTGHSGIGSGLPGGGGMSVALHKQQIYLDLSGWSPKYFPPQLVRYANTLLRERVLFGSDYPMLTPDRWLDDFERLEIRPEVRPLILKENAARLLGLRAAP